jgi:phosphopantetheine adenylyltransferase
MKKKIPFIIALAGLILTAGMFGCKGKKEAAPEGEVEVKVYCSGPDYFSNNEYFRANAIGESVDQMTSKKKALSNAKAELASSINTVIKGTTDNYVNSREFNNVENVEERFEGLTREIINQELSGVKTICEKMTKTQNGTYKTYIAIELSGDELVSKINEKLSKDERLKIDYDYEKFKKTFDEEMSKLENN